MIGLVPIPSALELLDLALHQIALQRADMGDVQSAVQVIGLVEQRAREKILAGVLELLALDVLRADGDALPSANLLAKSRNAETALFAVLAPFDGDDLWVDD